MTYQPTYRSRYKRRRRRNSHYGVLIALILVIIIAVPVAIHLVKGLSGAVFGASSKELVYQLDNSKAYAGGELIDLGAAPYQDESGNALVPLKSLCDKLDLTLSWESASKTATVTHKKDTLYVQAGSQTLRHNDQTSTMAAKTSIVNGATFVPVRDFCQALSCKVSELGDDQGNLIVISRSKKELGDDKLGKIADDALKLLGPSRQQVLAGSVLMRVESDKLIAGGETKQMKEEGKKAGAAATVVDAIKFVPLKAAVEALGGTAEFDGKSDWTVTYQEIESKIPTDGKPKVNGKSVKGENVTVFSDEQSGRFYVSAELFAAVIGAQYTDLADENGTFAFTKMPLDGFDSQKAYLDSLQNELTASVGGNIPDADVYIALTFDDGPTGAGVYESYPNGLTNYLMEELAKRNAHATFFMVGNRIKMFESVLPLMAEGGHELGNHTMTHPMEHLTGLDAESVRDQVASNNDVIKQVSGYTSTVMRPVGGGVNDTVKEQMKALGMPIINWSVDTQDWKVRDKESVRSAIVNHAGDGDIVLMHDLYPTSVEGALAAIDDLQSQTGKTYAFVTVSELAAIKGVTLEPGVVYNNLSDATVQQINDGTYDPVTFL
ncbi:MAG: polysaccharide deacetylase family protein [Eubacteriales bacterium]|nr:polysaccharide deacetylase family protein [Eubacteriales bacterium]